MKTYADPRDVEVIAPNLKRRLSGVTSTIIQLIPAQRRMGLEIATIGPGLPDSLPSMRMRDLWKLWLKPKRGRFRVWHARRNVEMIAGIFLRNLLQMPVKLVFTSAAQRNHKLFTKWLIRRMDKVIATSARSGSFLEVPHQIILHGIDTGAFAPGTDEAEALAVPGPAGNHLVGCSGRIRRQKGTDLFVEAMLTLLPEFPDWTAVITGRTTREHVEFQKALAARIAGCGLKERVVFVGEVKDIRAWYARFSLFVAPSRNEGFGLTPLEAMACGTAVVTSDAGAYRELVGKGAGTVVPAGDLEELTRAIRIYFSDIEMTRQSGVAARQHVLKNFRLENEAGALLDVYRALID